MERIEEEESHKGGIIIPDSAKEKPQQGIVIATGNGKRQDNGDIIPLEVKQGDRILFGKYAGNDVTIDNTEYAIFREDDVLAVLQGAEG